MRKNSLVLLLPLVAAVACDGKELPPLSNATALQCPYPGALPFRTSSTSFASAAAKAIVVAQPISKDEASDTIGVMGGVRASIYIADSATPSNDPIDYRGVKARTTAMSGLSSEAVGDEFVSLWSYDSGAWQTHGRTRTSGAGLYEVNDSMFVAPNASPLYAMLEGDGSCAIHYNYLLPTATKFVVFDIDGTLTTDDNEFLLQLNDESYQPKMMVAGNDVVKAWAQKGYAVVYLTARAHVFRAESRAWLDALGFPPGPLITTNLASDTQDYKALWLNRMIDTFGWQIVAAYGNAETDIGAYAAAGIPTDVTFIIGPHAGEGGTVAIANQDYTSHLAGFVAAQPAAN